MHRVHEQLPREPLTIVAVSGGPDSVYLLLTKLARRKENEARVIVGHVNYGSRGKDSQEDQRFVEGLASSARLVAIVLKAESGAPSGMRAPGRAQFRKGFEWKARELRHGFLKKLAGGGTGKVVMGHTADDQVETILMRVFEGAGISGLKGIPRESSGYIEHPNLHIWREDILKYLNKHGISYRIDKSNLDNKFERNWIRNVLIPLLVRRYGKAVKRRIFILGERFREMDDYLAAEARKWIRQYVKSVIPGKSGGMEDGAGGDRGTLLFPRAGYSRKPTVVRVKILQRISFDRLGVAPNERLLASMDRLVREGGPSANLKVGKGWQLKNRYGEAAFVPAGDGRKSGNANGKTAASLPGVATGTKADILVEEKGKVTPAQAKRASASGRKEYFDAAAVRTPVSVRPLRAGDRIRPFGLASEKKVKQILIDRKVPRDERWGRPVVCDAEGTILWIPGVVRSAHGPVGPKTEKTVLLKTGRK